jgi:hypothetical protein
MNLFKFIQINKNKIEYFKYELKHVLKKLLINKQPVY